MLIPLLAVTVVGVITPGAAAIFTGGPFFVAG